MLRFVHCPNSEYVPGVVIRNLRSNHDLVDDQPTASLVVDQPVPARQASNVALVVAEDTPAPPALLDEGPDLVQTEEVSLENDTEASLDLTPTIDRMKNMTIKQLRDLCTDEGINSRGTKSTLLERLITTDHAKTSFSTS